MSVRLSVCASVTSFLGPTNSSPPTAKLQETNGKEPRKQRTVQSRQYSQHRSCVSKPNEHKGTQTKQRKGTQTKQGTVVLECEHKGTQTKQRTVVLECYGRKKQKLPETSGAVRSVSLPTDTSRKNLREQKKLIKKKLKNKDHLHHARTLPSILAGWKFDEAFRRRHSKRITGTEKDIHTGRT